MAEIEPSEMRFCCQISLWPGSPKGSQGTRRWSGISFPIKETHGTKAAAASPGNRALCCDCVGQESKEGNLPEKGRGSKDWL